MKKFFFFAGIIVLFLVSGCIQSTPICGNMIVEGKEACDSNNLNGQTCQTQGFSSGTLTCSSTCLNFDTTHCTKQSTAICGNGTIENNEKCDGDNLNGKTCQSFGYSTGTLACSSTCTFSIQNCQNQVEQCGNGIIEGAERCDNNNLQNNDGCNSNCLIEDGWRCNGQPSNCISIIVPPVCGNGAIEGTEQCDDSNGINNDGCSSVCLIEEGWRCNNQPSICTRVTPMAVCGNGVLENNEQCDQGNNNRTNGDGCNNNCQVESEWNCTLTPSNCTRLPICGNNVREGNEACDGTDLAGQTCQSQGFDNGTLRCNSSCVSFDTNSCISTVNLCKPLYENHNAPRENRINFVFEGVQYDNVETLVGILKNFIDLDSINAQPGLFGQEPFKSNQNLFNFWYIDQINNCGDPSTNCTQQAQQYYTYCNYPHTYYFRFFDSNAPGGWSANPNNANVSGVWAFTPRLPYNLIRQERFYVLHEFGHTFTSPNLNPAKLGILLDEYGGQFSYPNYDYILRQGPWTGKIFPNVFLDTNATAIEDCKQQAPWKDLIGNGCGQDGIEDCIQSYTPHQISPTQYEQITCKPEHPDCYKEISCFEAGLGYWKGVFRPSFRSIMNSSYRDSPAVSNLEVGYNLASQRHFCNIFKAEIGTCTGTCTNLIAC